MLPTRLTMRLITMRVVQSIQPDLLRRCHRLELVPCHQEGKEGQMLAMALSTMAGIVNQGDQLAMLLLHSKARGVVFGFVFQDRVDFSTLGSTATAKKQEAARYYKIKHLKAITISSFLCSYLPQEERHYPEVC